MGRKNLKLTIYILVWYIIVFQTVLQRYIKIFQYFDEMLAILFFPVAIYNIVKNKGKLMITKRNLIIMGSLAIIIVLGLCSNIIYKYQTIQYVLADVLVCVKFFLVYFLFQIIDKKNIDKYKTITIKNIEFITIILIILTQVQIC